MVRHQGEQIPVAATLIGLSIGFSTDAKLRLAAFLIHKLDHRQRVVGMLPYEP